MPILKPEQFPDLPDNIEYVRVGLNYSNKSLYNMMKLSAGKLYRDFLGPKSMSGWIQVKLEKVKEATPGVEYTEDEEGAIIAKALTMFDTGRDGAGVTAAFAKNRLWSIIRSRISWKTLSIKIQGS